MMKTSQTTSTSTTHLDGSPRHPYTSGTTNVPSKWPSPYQHHIHLQHQLPTHLDVSNDQQRATTITLTLASHLDMSHHQKQPSMCQITSEMAVAAPPPPGHQFQHIQKCYFTNVPVHSPRSYYSHILS